MKRSNKKISSPHFGQSFKKMNKFQKIMIISLLLMMAFASLPVMLVLIIGLLPTIIIMALDRSNHDKQIIVGCFNLAGVFTYLFSVINDFSVYNAFFIVGDVFNLILMLGSAGVGLVLYSEIPAFYVHLLRNSYNKRLEKIDKRLEVLTEEWGVELSQNSQNNSSGT